MRGRLRAHCLVWAREVARLFLFNTMMSPGILMNTYLCIVCGFVYDESSGRPEEGIAPGTLWDAVPADWACPECGVAKSDFEMVVI